MRSSTAQQAAAPVMRWEYRSEDASAIGGTPFLNLGNDGWEFVTVAHTRSNQELAIFKRPKQ
jgi:hypothetical protein